MTLDKDAAASSALRIAGDPGASEKQWMAACTLIEGKKLPIGNAAAGPAWVGLPWSMCVSGLSGLGGFLLFGSLCAGVTEALSAFTGIYLPFNGAVAFILLGSAFVTFSTIFAYQRHLWNGGKIWATAHWSAVGLCALLPFGLQFFDLISSVDLLAMFGAWGVGFIGLSAVATTCANRNVKALECSIGARRVVPYTRAIYSLAGVCLLSFMALHVPGFLFNYTFIWGWFPVLLLGSGFYIAYKNRAANPNTATVLGLSVWNPLILCNLFLLPALAVHSVASIFTSFSLQIGFFDYGVCLASMALLVAGPSLGALVASRGVQRANKLELHRVPEIPSLAAVPIQSAPIALTEETA